MKSRFCLLFCLAFGFTPLAQAAVSLSVNTVEGGNSLRLDQPVLGLSSPKEIRIRVTSSDGRPYQVFQRLQEPLRNDQGERLNTNALESAAVPNSNASGTLYQISGYPLGMGDQLLYSSAQGGESDGFTVAYQVRPELIKASGQFTGQLLISVRSSGQASSDQAIINVFFHSESQWKTEIKGSRTPNRVKINIDQVPELSLDYVDISFTGNASGAVKIYQDFDLMPVNEEGRELTSEALMYYGSGQTPGLLPNSIGPVRPGRTLIYDGQANEDRFLLYYVLNPKIIDEVAPGTYNGKVRFVVEYNNGREEQVLDVYTYIQPVFTMDITAGAGGVNFTNLLASDPPQEKVVKVRVKSNLGKPYQVLSNMLSPLANEKGQAMDKQYFTFKVELEQGQGGGRTKYEEFTAVETGEYPIFISDAKGSPKEFKVVYRLQGYEQMNPGQFAAPITYTLNQN